MIKTLRNLFKQDKEKFVVPKSVQAVIPIKTIWEDGIFLVGRNKYAKTFKFEDINYAVASRGKSYGKAYESDEPNPFFLRCYNQYHLLDGDAEIASGLRVTPVPGHTAGSQAVLVETEKGRIVLANDVINVLENWTEGILPGNVADFDAYHRSLETLKKYELEGWRIVPGHDFRVFTTLAPLFNAIYPPQN